MSFTSYPRTRGDNPPLTFEDAYAWVPEPMRGALTRYATRVAHLGGDLTYHPAMLPSMPRPSDIGVLKGLLGEDAGLVASAAKYLDVGAQFLNPIEIDALNASLPDRTVWLQQHDVELGRRFVALKPYEANSFAAIAPLRYLTTLADDTPVWRFLGSAVGVVEPPDLKLACARPDGPFWGVGPVPATEAEWRSRYAVPPHWNGDGTYLATTVGQLREKFDFADLDARSIVGLTAPQIGLAPSDERGTPYYVGGGLQLFCPNLDIRRVEVGEPLPDFRDLMIVSAWRRSK